MNQPHIVSVFWFGPTADGRPFLVMEHLRGRTLRAELEFGLMLVYMGVLWPHSVAKP